MIMSEKAPYLAARLNELKEIEAKLEAELAPAREAHDRLVNAPELAAARATIKRCNAELLPIKNELAALAKALPGYKGGIAIESGEFSG